jgi:hypothetical protein
MIRLLLLTIYHYSLVINGIFIGYNPDLIHCTNEPNVSILQLANFLLERSQNSNWVVVLKSLVTTHHLMCYGNEVTNLIALKFIAVNWLNSEARFNEMFEYVFGIRDSHSIWLPATVHFSYHLSWIKRIHRVSIQQPSVNIIMSV